MNVLRLKKRHPKFNVPNQGAIKRSRVPDRWRKQRGIDSKKRIKKDFMGAEPTIGYGSPESVKGVRINGNRIVLVHNLKEMQSIVGDRKSQKNVDVTIAAPVAVRKRVMITELAEKNGIRVTNGAYR
jgi:large subunit ribosomal protein L32e